MQCERLLWTMFAHCLTAVVLVGPFWTLHAGIVQEESPRWAGHFKDKININLILILNQLSKKFIYDI